MADLINDREILSSVRAKLNATLNPYPTRAEFEAATIPAGVVLIYAIEAGDVYQLVRDPTGDWVAGDGSIWAATIASGISYGLMLQAQAAAEAAADRAEAVGIWDSRADLAAWIAEPNTPVDGRTYIAGGLSYQGRTGSTSIPDMPGLSAVFPTPQHYGAVGDGVTDDTLAFTRAAAANRFVEVFPTTGGYNVANTVVAPNTMFFFRGATASSQLKGTATTDNIFTVSHVSSGVTQQTVPAIFLHKLDVIKKVRTTTFGAGAYRSNDYGLFISLDGPDPTDPEGELDYMFNRLVSSWRVGRVPGTGLNGSATSSVVRGGGSILSVGGANYDVQSANAWSSSLLHDQDDTCAGDKVGGGSGIRSTASSPGKLYGGSTGLTIDSGGSTPQGLGHETDVFIEGTGTVVNAGGYNAWSGGDNQATNTYSAFLVGSNGTPGKARWKAGLTLYTGTTGTPLADKQPIDTTGTLFDVDNNMTLQDIFRFNETGRTVTVTGHILDFPNVQLTGAGALNLAGPITGNAVTQTATDTTAGRLLKVGDSATLLSASPALRATYGGTADAITLTTGAGISGTPPTGLRLRFRATAENTGATTIALDGGATRTVLSARGSGFPAGYIRTDRDTEVTFNGTVWIASRAIESGYDATNGAWTRHEDGRQTCDAILTSSASAAITWTYAKPFSSALKNPSVNAFPSGPTPRDMTWQNRGTTSVDFNMFDNTGTRVAAVFDASATGFWF